MILTSDEIERYHRQGYLSVHRPVLDPRELADASARIDRLFSDWREYPRSRLTGNIRLRDDSPGVSGIMGACSLDRGLARLPMMKSCRQIASELLGGERTWFHFDHVVSKDSGDETEVKWHQDYAYSTTGLTRRSVHFWVPLQSISAEHGSMVYLPGSHLGGLRRHEAVTRTGELTKIATVEEEGIEVPPVEIGGIVCHDPMTLHYSRSNHSGAVRRAWVLHFGTGVWPAMRHLSGPVLMAVAQGQRIVGRTRSGATSAESASAG